MKRQERTSTPIKAVTAFHMKESKSENSSLSSHQKGTLVPKPAASPLGKTYLSKSHENLSSHQKKKLATLADPPHRPKSSLGITKGGSSNKENLVTKGKDNVFLKPKPVKSGGMSTIRKASSTQQLDKTGALTPRSTSAKSSAMKRAHSSHNVSKDKSSRKRTSAPADVMAYNAELLANFEKDKKEKESRISELIQVAENRKAEIEKYRYETKRLKEQIPTHDIKDELEFLRKENILLREQLQELGYPVEQITDTEKLSILQEKNAKKNMESSESSFPKSKSCDSLDTDEARGGRSISCKGEGTDRPASTAASEPILSLADQEFSLENSQWEKGSNKSSDALSEISVACLTERILQMEETHYSTNEELQATLQELGDLQQSVNELNAENEKLLDQKYVLLESLCTQTEKLEHCRVQIEQLKSLLISGNFPERSEREQQLLELLKGAQDEREEFLCKQTELVNILNARENECRELGELCDTNKDKLQLMEDKLNSLKSEKEICEKTISDQKKTIDNEKIEMDHLKTLLENEKSKVQELEQYCKAADSHSELEELLHNTRQEKDKLESKLADMKESLQHAQCELGRGKESLTAKEEELKVCKNNAKTEIQDLKYQLEKLEKGKTDSSSELSNIREHIEQLKHDCNKYKEEKNELLTQLSEAKEKNHSLQQEKATLEVEIMELKSRHTEESEEWTQFQRDLQVAVLVANNFRAETQEDMEKVQQENSTYREKCRVLTDENKKLLEEVDRLKLHRSTDGTPKSILSSAELKGKMLNSVGRELANLRDKRTDPKTQSQSVKSLIRSIEEQVKSGCSSIHSSTCNSRRNSDCSMDETVQGIPCLHNIVKSPSSPISENPSVFSSSASPEVALRSVLRKQVEKPSPLRHSVGSLSFDPPRSPIDSSPKSAPPVVKNDSSPSLTSILSRNSQRRSSGVSMEPERKDSGTKDPLAVLAKQMGGSKRNALLKWCQQKTVKYSNVDITNFSSSWNDGLAFCALLHSYLPDKIPFAELNTEDKRRNFTLAFEAAEGVGISSSILNIGDMVAMERPDWQAVMAYVTSIYKHFEHDAKTSENT
ncbi:cytospin-A-like [Saccostrea cucullata]|uniref:cytospin-A-like n=1 Tax=Saccostrea cuccullata TaxID=36930 RepID=UPI002ED16CA9